MKKKKTMWQGDPVSHNIFYKHFIKSLEITELCVTLCSNIRHISLK